MKLCPLVQQLDEVTAVMRLVIQALVFLQWQVATVSPHNNLCYCVHLICDSRISSVLETKMCYRLTEPSLNTSG